MVLFNDIIKPLFLEHRTAAYTSVCEERSTENQDVLAKIVELSTAPKRSQPNQELESYNEVSDSMVVGLRGA